MKHAGLILFCLQSHIWSCFSKQIRIKNHVRFSVALITCIWIKLLFTYGSLVKSLGNTFRDSINITITMMDSTAVKKWYSFID